MNNPINPKGVGALHEARIIQLIRCENGWLVKSNHREENIIRDAQPVFCFQSTTELAKHLVPMLGETKWVVSEPARDEKGKFQPKAPKE